jgi:membrane protein YqaA with SNARE-associated domain
MTVDTLGAELGIYAGTLVICFVSGLVPFVNAEAWLVAVTLLVANAAPLPAVVALAAIGQMAAKSLLYFTALGALRLPTGRYRDKVDKARAALERWKRRPNLLLFTSASVGLPPLYVTTLLAGGLGYRFRSFLAIGTLGRAARFAVIVALAWTGAS